MIKLKESLEEVAGKIGYEIMEIKNLKKKYSRNEFLSWKWN